MAKPDTDDGWIKLAHELRAALAFADFSKGARIVLEEVFSQLFGPAKLRSATLSPTRIAGETGQCRSVIARAVRELADSGVLRRLPDGTYRFIKDYESWVCSGGRGDTPKGPRLTPAEVVSARNAPGRVMVTCSQPATRSQPANPSNSVRSQSATENVANGLQERSQPATPSVANRLRAVPPPPGPPLVNAHAEFKKFENGEVQEGERDSLSLSRGRDESEEQPGTAGVAIDAIWERAFGKKKGT